MGLQPLAGLTIALESGQAEALGLSGILRAVDVNVTVGVAAALHIAAFDATSWGWVIFIQIVSFTHRYSVIGTSGLKLG